MTAFPGRLDDLFGAIHFDRHGTPISAERFSRLKFEAVNRTDIVGKTWHGTVEISTVWLGLTHGLDPQGRPLIFETGLFGVSDDLSPERDVEIVLRYATEAEALFGHRLIVGYCRINDPLPALNPGPPRSAS